MIIVNLAGGLGNQMFQYACARALALELDFPLKITHDMLGKYAIRRRPELERAFSLNTTIAEPKEMRQMIGALRTPVAVRRALGSKMLAFLRCRRFIVEPHFHYWEGILKQTQMGGYLQGYWQSERYFSNHAATIRSDFTFSKPFTGRNAELARAIQENISVSVHVRRGDYVSNPKIHARYEECSPKYYGGAMVRLCQALPEPRFFIFSDDPQWATEALAPHSPDLVLVDNNRGENSFKDMQLMALCHHHIIANSTFSWWGAWLNPNPDKIIIAPNHWFADGTDTGTLLPSSWLRL